jgi:hypothetical protein
MEPLPVVPEPVVEVPVEPVVPELLEVPLAPFAPDGELVDG